MKNHIRWGFVVVALTSLTSFGASRASAQLQEMPRQQRFQIAGFAGYQWGGSFETSAFGNFSAGALKLNGAANYGGVMSFLAEPYTAVELWYLRSDDNIYFQPLAGIKTDFAQNGFATNYFHIGGRQEFPTGTDLHPFINGSLGITVFDPKAPNIGTSTRFSFALGGGLQYMMGAEKRFGVLETIARRRRPESRLEYQQNLGQRRHRSTHCHRRRLSHVSRRTAPTRWFLAVSVLRS